MMDPAWNLLDGVGLTVPLLVAVFLGIDHLTVPGLDLCRDPGNLSECYEAGVTLGSAQVSVLAVAVELEKKAMEAE